jgi:hypothetical protein
VGIGTTPASGVILHINDATDPILRLQRGGAAYSQFSSDSGGSLFIRADEGNTGSSSRMQLDVDGNEIMRLDGGNVIVNEQSRDIDFRVESNNYSHLLFVDAGNDVASVGTSVPNTSYSFHVSGVNLSRKGIRIDTDGDTTQLSIGGNGNVEVDAPGVAGGRFIVGHTGTTIINEAGSSVDFRVESDTDTHALFVDGSSNTVSIRTSSAPSSPATLNVAGGVQVQGRMMSAIQEIYQSGSGRVFSMSAGGNGQQIALTFKAMNFNGYIEKQYYFSNQAGSWVKSVDVTIASSGTVPTITYSGNGSTPTITVVGAGNNPGYFNGGFLFYEWTGANWSVA